MNSDTGHIINNYHMPNDIHIVEKSVVMKSDDISTDLATSVIDLNLDTDLTYIENTNHNSNVNRGNNPYITNSSHTLKDFDFNKTFKYIISRYGYEGIVMKTRVYY